VVDTPWALSSATVVTDVLRSVGAASTTFEPSECSRRVATAVAASGTAVAASTVFAVAADVANATPLPPDNVLALNCPLTLAAWPGASPTRLITPSCSCNDWASTMAVAFTADGRRALADCAVSRA
jgi:hypothetical protein